MQGFGAVGASLSGKMMQMMSQHWCGGVMNHTGGRPSLFPVPSAMPDHSVRLQLSSRFPKTIVEPSFSDAVLHAQTGVSKNVETPSLSSTAVFLLREALRHRGWRGAASKGDAKTHHLADLLVVLIEAGKPQ